MTPKPYGMICPITHACELLEPRWTIPILTELWAGSTRFNDLRRGIGSISPALLSKRLKELEAKGLVDRVEDKATGQVDYFRTRKAIDLEPALNALADWAQRHIKAETALCDGNLSSMMFKMRRYFLEEALPDKQVVMQFRFDDPGLDYNIYWALIRPGLPVEICTSVPGFEVDLFIETNQQSLASILLARTTVARELEAGRLYLSGDPALARSMDQWLHITDYGGGEAMPLAIGSRQGVTSGFAAC